VNGKLRGNIRLAAIFVIAFALPLGLFYLISSKNDLNSDEGNSEHQIISSSVPIVAPNRYISVPTHPVLSPQTDSDFVLFSWIRPRAFPESERDVIFLARIGPDPAQEGFGLGYRREGRAVRPVVHWKDSSGRGERYLYGELSILPGEWIMLVVSYLDGQYLAVHAVQADAHGELKVRLLGGHQVDEVEAPAGQSDLVLGALAHGLYRGRIGPFGIVGGQGLADRLPQLFEEILLLTTSRADKLTGAEAKLLVVEPGIDQSRFKHSVDLSSIPRFSAADDDE